jgi:16S rRNA (uracil1498-N3)-methyltransferase
VASLYLNPTLESAEIGSAVSIAGDEAKHAVTVARTRVGERLSIGNGRGLLVGGVVTSLDPFSVEVDDVQREGAPDPALWLVQALAKGDRDELAVQAATELGVSGVIPWVAERSVTRWEGAKLDKGRARWEAIVREASKQSIRAWVPEVGALISTGSITGARSITEAGSITGGGSITGAVLVLDPTAEQSLSSVALPSTGRISLVVGPEGGISPRELDLLEKGGATRVRLGAEILRTSTAGPAAIAVLNLRLGRW